MSDQIDMDTARSVAQGMQKECGRGCPQCKGVMCRTGSLFDKTPEKEASGCGRRTLDEKCDKFMEQSD